MKERNNEILVPVNFTDRSDKGIEIAMDIAKSWNATVTFMHVISLPQYEGLQDEQNKFVSVLKENVEKKLEELRNKYKSLSIKTNSKVVVGKALPEILKYIKSANVRLVVLGSKQYKNMEEMLEGTTTERMIRFATAPVLTIKEGYDITQVSDIVFASDLGSTNVNVTKELSDLQDVTNAKLHLIKVNTKDDWITDEEAKKKLDEFNKVHELKNVAFKTINADSVEKGILDYAKNIGADIVAMSTHSMNKMPVGINKYFITEKVLQSMPKLIWTYMPN